MTENRMKKVATCKNGSHGCLNWNLTFSPNQVFILETMLVEKQFTEICIWEIVSYKHDLFSELRQQENQPLLNLQKLHWTGPL